MKPKPLHYSSARSLAPLLSHCHIIPPFSAVSWRAAAGPRVRGPNLGAVRCGDGDSGCLRRLYPQGRMAAGGQAALSLCTQLLSQQRLALSPAGPQWGRWQRHGSCG